MRDSDATVIFTLSGMQGGTLLTEKLATEKPCLHIGLGDDDLGKDNNRQALLQPFIVVNHAVKVRNVAGPRESEEPGIPDAVEIFLEKVLAAEYSACYFGVKLGDTDLIWVEFEFFYA